MSKSTIITIVGLGAAYFFLTSRQPVFAKQADGSYLPAGLLDKLTVALTGAHPPAAVPPASYALNIPGILDASYTA